MLHLSEVIIRNSTTRRRSSHMLEVSGDQGAAIRLIIGTGTGIGIGIDISIRISGVSVVVPSVWTVQSLLLEL